MKLYVSLVSWGMLAAGAVCAAAAVQEIGVYALFAEGGRFHHAGFFDQLPFLDAHPVAAAARPLVYTLVVLLRAGRVAAATNVHA